MNDFIRYILWELKNSLVLVFLAGIAVAGVLVVCCRIHTKRHGGQKKFPWGKVVIWLMFAAYLVILIYATMLRGAGVFRRHWNLHLFRAWREAWNNFSVKSWANVLLNVALFGPLGFLLPLLGKKFRKGYLTLPLCFGVSLLIELGQLAVGRGVCDIDDLFCNTLGGAMGYFAAMAVLTMVTGKEKRVKGALAYVCLLLMPMLAVGGIFIAYEAREMGNLPMAPAYTQNTRNVTWRISCELPQKTDAMAVYQTVTLDSAACDELANELARLTGQEVLSVSYYQELAYYNLSRGILSVYYHDGSYEFSFGFSTKEDEWADADRETLEKALEFFHIQIPEEAQFHAEGDGWHSFTCQRYSSGNGMVDGQLRCRYASDGTVKDIENHLVYYTYAQNLPVISPEEAYARLRAGKFQDYGAFEYYKPEEISVIGCTLGYCIDTKGFYQPVYYFDIAEVNGSYSDRIMIPALE